MRIGRTAVLGGAFALGMIARAAFAQLDPCPEKSSCVTIAAGSPAEPTFRGGIVRIPISIEPGADDKAPGGVDEIAAISLSVSIPGLELADCSPPDENGLNPSFVIPSRITDRFIVLVENTSCAGRDRCLCPDKGQSRDQFVNLAITGPREIFPGPNQTEIPTLPSGELLSIWLRVGDQAGGDVPVHVFSETDDPKATPKPTFAGFVTLGDSQAVDVTADRKANVSRVRVVDGTVVVSTEITATVPPDVTESPTPDVGATETPADPTATVPATVSPTVSTTPDDTPAADCPGDCNRDRVVSIDELVRAVTIALDRASVDGCAAADPNGDGGVSIEELVRAVDASLSGCGGASVP